MAFPFLKSPHTYIGKELAARTDGVRASLMRPWVSVTSNLSTSNVPVPTGGKTLSTLSYTDVFGPNGGYDTTTVPGFRPKPIITDFSIDFSNRGTLRKGTIKIKCFNLPQVEEVQKFFLEPGISVFIQWGWNRTASGGGAVNAIGTDKVTQLKYYRRVQDLDNIREQNAGCYDNMVGIITGGTTSVSDGQFEVTSTISSIGELLMGLQQGDPHDAKLEEDAKSATYSAYAIDTFRTDDASSTKKVHWAYFFNELPDYLKTPDIKSWGEGGGGGNIFHETDFINFDERVVELVKDKQNTKFWGRDKLKLFGKLFSVSESDYPLTSKKYVRFSTFIAMLNKATKQTRLSTENGGQGGVLDYSVNIEHSFCGCFRGIFSCNENVFIPNKLANNWFKSDPNYAQSVSNPPGSTPPKEINNGIADMAGKPSVSLPDLDMRTRIGRILKTVKDKGNTYELTSSDDATATFVKLTVGWIGDIYISSDLAYDALKQVTTPIKDVLDAILTEMSKATDGFWDFQVTETTIEGATALAIIDLNLTNNSTDTPLSIDLYGPSSYVLSSNFTMDIPKAMASKVVMMKATATETEQKSTEAGVKGLFSAQKDVVLWDYVYYTPTKSKDDDKKDEDDDAIEKSRWKAFAGNSRMCVRPSLTNLAHRLQHTPVLDIIGYYPLYTDAIANKIKENANDIYLPGVSTSTEAFAKALRPAIAKGLISSSSPLPIKVEFTTMGISGFKVGDIMTIKGVPTQYTDPEKGAFMVIEIKHAINNKLWTTSVTAMYKPKAKS